MTTYFITRHQGALQWAEASGIAYDQHLEHLDPQLIEAGDTVIGTLPVNLAAEVCARGAEYLHLNLDLPRELRGRELSAQTLFEAGASLQCYFVQSCTMQPISIR